MANTLNTYIEHTLLKPEATTEQVKQLCLDAQMHQFKGVCINSWFVPVVKSELADSKVLIVSVIGFPLGAGLTSTKAFETEAAQKAGAHEIDMVLNVGALKEKNYSYIKADISSVCKASPAKVKVILETGLLDEEEIRTACKLSVEAGAAFVKTCTGFNIGVAEVNHIKIMREIVGPNIGVKASGGIKTADGAWSLIRAGADRLGTSSGVALVTGTKSTGGY